MNTAPTITLDLATLDLAIAHHQAGRIPEAEPVYRQILDADPDQPEALNLLGLILQNRGDIATSLDMIARAIEVDPEYAEAHANLARGQRALGRVQDAAESARRAIALDPDLAEAHLLLGRALLDLRDPPAAVAACRRAVALQPDLADGRLTLGIALTRVQDLMAAEDVLREANARQPDHPPILRALGVTLSEAEQHEEALPLLRRCVELAPSDPLSQLALVVGLGRAQHIKQAIEACQPALELLPKRVDLWVLLGSHVAALGDFATAERHFRHALTLDPSNPEALRELTSIGDRMRPRDDAAALLATLADEVRPPADRITAGFGLGAIHDAAGAYDSAFDYYRQANALALALRRTEGRVFNRDQFQETIRQAIASYTSGAFMATVGWGDPSELPVFIVGMPRSGTTLVEQIAASHPAVFGGGERKDIPLLLDRLTSRNHALSPLAWSRLALRREAAAHIERLAALAPGCQRVTDKLPDNIQAVGPIAILFPSARIILCRRDLRDVCLSCYTQRFSEGLPWTHDFTDLAVRAREVERLTAHWRQVVPARILEVRYERLVGDLEGQSRRLIDFLGLPWDPACLNFHRTERAVLTASRWQVRQPIYTRSVGRWRLYRKHLGPLREGLAGLVGPDTEA